MHQAVMEAHLATDKASYSSGEKVRIAVTLRDGKGPVAEATVHLTVRDANGRTMMGAAGTGADGESGLSYDTDARRHGAGMYTVEATASKDGYEPAESNTAFEVTEAD